MPRDGSNVYSPPTGTTAVSGDTISSSAYNSFIQDLTADLNAARPISAGGTGATSASAARTSLGVQAYSAELSAIAAFSTTGFAVRTADDTWAQRTITGTSGKITITDGNGVAGNPTITVGADIAQLTEADQVITGGARVTSLSLGTITTGTVTPDPGDRPLQHYTNNGAHTLAPGSNTGSYLLDITNAASAGAITTSGWTKKVGDAFTTTNGHKFRCSCSVGDAGSLLVVQAMQ